MTWWDSFEALSKLQTALAILVSVLGVLTLTIKLRADQLKRQTDTRRSVERTHLDKELQAQTAAALKATAVLEARTRNRTISDLQERELIARLASAPRRL